MSKNNKITRVKIIANPRAGNPKNSEENLQLVTDNLEKYGFNVDLALVKPKEGAAAITRHAIKDGYKFIVAMGGDGTIEAVMRGMTGSKARLGVIPSGTKNNIAKSLGIPTKMKEAIELVVSDHTLKLDLGQVTTRKGGKFIFFEMATIGLSMAVDPTINNAMNDRLSGLRVASMTFLHQEVRPKVFLTLDDEREIEVETMLVVVSTKTAFGKNLMRVSDAPVLDGMLDISVFPDFGKAELLRYYADMMDGRYSGDGTAHHYQARKVQVKSSPKLDVMADGVMLGNGKVTIKVRTNMLRVITKMQAPTPEKVEETEILEQPFSLTAGKNHRDISVPI